MNITWEHKLAAMQELGGDDVQLRMRKPGDWYLNTPSVEIGGNGVLRSAYSNGATPEEAVLNTWADWLSLPSDHYLQVSRLGRTRRYVWGQFMWKELT